MAVLASASEFARHQSVNHSIGEYVRGDAHTNTIEGYFSILKRGITGTYHHVSPQHLKRYLAEFDFRYNERAAFGVNDEARADKLIRGIVGKRLMYKDSSPASIATGGRVQLELPMAMPRKPKSDASKDGAEYRFKIDAYTPDTIPMASTWRATWPS